MTTTLGTLFIQLHFLALTNGSITPFLPVIDGFFRFLPPYFASPCFLVN
nr:MAG TPA: hypothetical protein [Caudoviricetes sp.]